MRAKPCLSLETIARLFYGTNKCVERELQTIMWKRETSMCSLYLQCISAGRHGDSSRNIEHGTGKKLEGEKKEKQKQKKE